VKVDNIFGEVGVRCTERHLSSLITFLLQSESGSAKASTELKKILRNEMTLCIKCTEILLKIFL